MEILTPIQGLDSVLEYLANNRGAHTPLEILTTLNKKDAKMATDELYRHLNQLVADKYIREENNHNGIGEYSILTSGAVLNLEGGYSQKYHERERLKQLEIRQAQIAERLFWANAFIAFATLIAAIYYLLQIWKFFQPHYGPTYL